MKVLLQRVSEASVEVAGECVASIGAGLLALVGVAPEDGEQQLQWLADKTLGLRIFPDEAKPMNLSVTDVSGELLVVSQFTLAADTSRGRRPGFSGAAAPQHAEAVYDRYATAQCGMGKNPLLRDSWLTHRIAHCLASQSGHL